MAREIKFRAQTDDGKWVVGDLHLLNAVPSIQTDANTDHTYHVDVKTIGMFTGLKYFDGPDDTDGTEIYEGDIVRIYRMANKYNVISAVEYNSGSFQVKDMWPLSKYASTCEVIGNIYDNPELLNK